MNIADTRTWRSLPKKFQYVRLATPADRKLTLGAGPDPDGRTRSRQHQYRLRREHQLHRADHCRSIRAEEVIDRPAAASLRANDQLRCLSGVLQVTILKIDQI